MAARLGCGAGGVMTRPWSVYLRKATDLIPPMPGNLRAELLRLLVPELADLRQQLDQARRLASEAQQRYRRAEEMARAFMNDGTLVTWQSMQAERDKLREKLTLEVKNATRLAAEGDQLRARVAGLEAGKHRLEIELAEEREENEALAFDKAKETP